MASADGTGGDRTTSAAAEDDADHQQQALEYSRCMRDNGLPDFPDAEFNGNGGVHLGLPDGLDPESEGFKAAQEACKQHLPNGGEPPEPDPERLAKMREYAQCMRENGLPDFPDPNEDGGIQFGGDGLDPESPEFQAADKACEDVRPGEPGGRSTKRDGEG